MDELKLKAEHLRKLIDMIDSKPLARGEEKPSSDLPPSLDESMEDPEAEELEPSEEGDETLEEILRKKKKLGSSRESEALLD